MALTAEEKRARQVSPKLNELQYTADNDGKDFVFISYKSDDWKEVLEDIVYRLQKQTGLRIYYDRAFDDDNAEWLEQMKAAMETPFCKGILVFISEAYMTSYATLMEILYSQSEEVKERHNYRGLEVFEILLDFDINSPEEIKENFSKDRDTCKKSVVMGETEWNVYKDLIEEIASSKSIENDGFQNGAFWLTKKEKGKLTLEDLAIAFSRILVGNKIQKSNEDYFYTSLGNKLKNYNDRNNFDLFDESLIETTKAVNRKPNVVELNPKVLEKSLERVKKEIEKPKEEVAATIDKPVTNKDIKKQFGSKGKKEKLKPGFKNYKLYGKEYTSNQSNLMFNVFEQVLEKHPHKIKEVANTLNCASKIDYSLRENKSDQMKGYFNTCRNFVFANGNTICIGTSHNYKGKLRAIERLLSICNENNNILEIEGEQSPEVKENKSKQILTLSLIEGEKIGAYAKRLFYKLFTNNKVSEEEVKQMLTQEYATNNLKLGYPLLSRSREGNIRVRYWKDALIIHDEPYYLCSQWYEHQRKNLEEWGAEKLK